MQKKGKKTYKRITALVLCAILLVTSLPLALAVGGSYDPVPVFTAEARAEGASAWLTDEGSIVVRFPQAEAQKSWDDAQQKTIQFYLLELVDLGDVFSLHTEEVKLSKTYVSATETDKNDVVIPAEEISAFWDDTHRYSVSVIAVDSENWFSQPITAIVSDTPEFVYDADAYAPLVEDEHAMREMLTFEKDGNSSNVQTGDTLSLKGTAEQTGAEDASGTDTTGYWFLVNTQATQENPQTFDTSLSRQTYDYTGAEEIWFWMDLSQVSVTGLSFRLRSNEKWWDGWRDQTINSKYTPTGTVNGTADVYGTIYSTAGYTGDNAYVYIQNTDGSWRKVLMNDGTIDLANYRGYIRIPTEFFCSETDTYVTASNENFWTRGDANEAWANSLKLSSAVLVDPAGTCIKDALLLQNRCYSYTSGIFGSTTNNYEVGTMLAAGVSVPTATDAKRATVTDGAVPAHDRNDNYYKAIEDVLSAGFSYTGISADSVAKSFFLDNVMFYRTDGGSYSENTLDGNVNTGNTVATYYNQKTAIQGVILDAIDTYISDPDYSDYRQVTYIEDLINGYRQAYTDAGMSTDFLSEDGLAEAAANLNRSETWQNFLDARQACIDNNTYGKANSETTDLVPELVKTLERIPTLDESVITVDDQYVSTIIKMYQVYRRLNLAQLTALGKAEEEKLMELFALVRDKLNDNTVAVGQQLADYPFIPFNTFEENTTVGQRAWQLENDASFSSQSDYRHTKGLVTYTTSDGEDLSTFNRTIDYAVSISERPNAAWANITHDGYNGTKGLSVTIDSSFEGTVEQSAVQDWVPQNTYHTLNVSRNSQSADDFSTFASNNMSDVNLGGLVKNMSDTDFQNEQYMPLSLVMYVDFTDLTSDFAFCVNIFTKSADGTDIKARPDMGAEIAIGSRTWWRMYYILDTDTGTWKRVYGDSRYAFRSTSTADSSVSLLGYRGYIAIPLRHFKTTNSTNSDMLCNDATLLNNIYAVQFGLGGSSMDNAGFTIDNIGFTYDPEYYSDVASGRNDLSYAEQFEATSLPAETFNKTVAAIDIYNSTSLSEQVSAAQALYDTLPDYQKSVESVQAAKALLDIYKGYVDSPSTIPHADYTPAELAALIEALPDTVKNASVSGDYNLPYPGYVQGESGAEVNYAAYGLTPELAQEIINYYEASYSRYSNTEKASITTEQKTALMNAYYAARRCTVTLETNLTQANEFYASLVNPGNYEQTMMPEGYKPEAVQDYCGSIDAYSSLNDVFTAYEDINYFAKTAIYQGSIDTISTKAGTGLYMWLQNTQSVTLDDGSALDAGILTLQANWQAIYDEASEKITNQELLSDELLQSIEDAVGYYNALSGTYRNTKELSDVINAILKLFPADAVSLDKDTIMLNSEALSDTATYKVEYSEQLPVPASDSELNYITITSANGALAADAFTADYNVTLTAPDGTVYSKKASDLATAFKVGTVANNTATPSDPLSLQIAVSLDDEIAFTRGSLTDTLTVKYYNANNEAITDANGDPIEKTVTVMYSMTNAYIVTIPADIEIDWGDTNSYDASYKVNTSLGGNASIDVSVADSTADPADLSSYKLTDTNANTLAYSPANFGTENFSGNTNGAAVDPVNKPAVSVSDWSGVPVSEYRTTLTYTVQYNSGN